MSEKDFYCNKHNIKKYKTVRDSWRCALCIDERIDKEKNKVIKLTKEKKEELK